MTGRCVEADELLFEEDPFVIGPSSMSELICLGCHSLLDDVKKYKACAYCNWPLCSEACSQLKFHRHECLILAKDTKKSGVPKTMGETPRYDIILTLRCLLLKRINPSQWLQLTFLENHVTELKESTQDSFYQALLMYLTRVLAEEKFSEKDIMTVRGTILSNCYESRHPSGSSLRGLYPLLSLTNHSCYPNVTIRETTTGQMQVRAVRNLQKDEQLKVSYLPTTIPIWQRKDYITKIHYFCCDCARCISPTELNIFFSAHSCQECKSKQPLHKYFRNWKCKNCNFQIENEKLIQDTEAMVEAINTVVFKQPFTVKRIKETLQKIEKKYHKTHYIWMLAAQKALSLLNKLPQYAECLSFKSDLWQGLLNIYGLLEPGNTRRRGK